MAFQEVPEAMGAAAEAPGGMGRMGASVAAQVVVATAMVVGMEG